MADAQSPPREESSSDSALPSAHSPTKPEAPRLPQIISHRGYKGRFPENTLCAVDGAVRAGTHALELDLHLTRDGVIVLSHDPSLKRCFGVKKKVADCDWEYLSTLRTTQAPHVPIPRLLDILEYLREPGREALWALLDIKVTNDPATIMRRIAETAESVPLPADSPPWHKRLVLGCWSARYLPPRDQYLPDYAIALISAHMGYARELLKVPQMAFNVNQQVLMGPLGRGFLNDVRAAGRPVYLWTVNAPSLMRWGIRNRVDGVITDDPALFKQVCEEWEKEQKESGGAVDSAPSELDRLTLGQKARIWLITILVFLLGGYFKRKYLPSLERVRLEKRDE
ncbi:PLC-like phosphodiesterase [Aspergillus varians]